MRNSQSHGFLLKWMEFTCKICVNDYVYMCTNNAIISNNQSKDLIALWCLHVKSKALHSCLHAISIILIICLNCGYFFTAIIHIPHCTAQMMDSERAGVLLAAVIIYFRLMQNIFVWLYSMLFWLHRNVMSINLPTLPWRSTRLCVFPRKRMLSSPPSILIIICII